MEARVHRIAASAPDDISGLGVLIDSGLIDPVRIVAVLGKTEGNGCVNDFTRGFATAALKGFLARKTGFAESEIERRVVLVMSGGTEGGLSPHWLVFETREGVAKSRCDRKALAVGTAITRPFAAEEIGRRAQMIETAAAVRAAMQAAGIEDPEDVHYVQVKWKSMAYSRGASALGVGLALGEVSENAADDGVVCRDLSLFSSRASTSAGVELLENQVLVVGNSPAWSGELVVAHDVMQDAIDSGAFVRALSAAGLAAGFAMEAEERGRLCAVLCKAEPSQSGVIRGARHVMLDDSDIASSRHARALVGGVLAGVVGTTMLFVSGGAEHQGPDGGGPVAVIARRAAGAGA